MIDWLVLLTPFILLAIFLLFVFVGCAEIGGLSKLHRVVVVEFTYVGGLQDNVLSIDWTFDIKLTYESGGVITGTIGGGPSGPDPCEGPFSVNEIKSEGETIVGCDIGIGPPSGGSVVCQCSVTVNQPPQPDPIKKERSLAEEFSFTLALDGSGNFILI